MRCAPFVLAILMWAVPAVAQAPTDMAVCRPESETPDQRIEACTKAMESPLYTQPAQLDAQVHRGKAWRDKQNFEKAIADFQHVADASPRHFGEALLEWGVTLRRMNRLEEAVAILERASSPSGRSHYEKGLALADLILHRQAVTAFDVAILTNHNYGAAYFQRGIAWYRLGDEARAMEDWSDTIRLGGDEAADAHVRRGDNWLRKREWNRAVLEYESALKLRPHHADARQGRDQVLRDAPELPRRERR